MNCKRVCSDIVATFLKRNRTMKTLLAAALLAASITAEAGVLVAGNKSGGKIVLTTRDCIVRDKHYENLASMYAITPDGALDRGCWYYVDKLVHVVYEDGEERAYELHLFNYQE